MSEGKQGSARQGDISWLEGHTPASIPYIIGFSIFIPVLLGANIALEFWIDPGSPWLTNLRDGLLNAGTMATWGIPLTIIATEVISRMLARSYIARKEREAAARLLQQQAELTTQREDLTAQREELAAQREELTAWHMEQVARWEERKRQAEADGKEFTEPPPSPPPGVNPNGQHP